jgi:formylglycine-generating enzyme required for sulfatase activity
MRFHQVFVFIVAFFLAFGAVERVCPVEAGGKDFAFHGTIFQAPSDPEQWPAWREALTEWRSDARKSLDYDGSYYDRAEFRWVTSCYSCCFAMLWDQQLWDHETGRFTVDDFLQDARRRFGGFDAILLWHAYPIIGYGPRNQWDFYRDQPGGLEGLRELTREFHERGVKVFIDYNPWDTETRREERSDVDMLVHIVKSIDADGIFLDTIAGAGGELRQKLDAVRPGVVLEPEHTAPLDKIHNHHMSWAQWYRDSGAPGVLRNAWFEPRHMMHQIHRHASDHSGELHSAWMNGSGMMVWENVFGVTYPWSPRDCSIYRLMLPVQRRYSEHFSRGNWKPLLKTEQEGVYASKWEESGVNLWTLVNRKHESIEGPLLKVTQGSQDEVYDLVRGKRAKAVSDQNEGLTLYGEIPARGAGCFLAAQEGSLRDDFSRFLQSQAELRDRYDPSTELSHPEERLIPVEPTTRYPRDDLPEDMVFIPGGEFDMQVHFRTRAREVGTYSAPLQRTVTLEPYAIDATPVTNAQFQRFLQASGYEPRSKKNFLEHWVDGEPPAGKDDHPVVYVSLEDARACAEWAGKRLPTEEEWQYAAQGDDGRTWPWGERLDPVTLGQYARFMQETDYEPQRPELFLRGHTDGRVPHRLHEVPIPHIALEDAQAYAKWAGLKVPGKEDWIETPEGPRGQEYPWNGKPRQGLCNYGQHDGTTPVRAFPRGRSPFGLYDMAGNVWELTESEREDGRNRFVILKGGSYFEVRVRSGANWYSDGGPRPVYWNGKFLLMWPGLTRSATIGFRCTVDVTKQ